VKCYINKRN